MFTAKGCGSCDAIWGLPGAEGGAGPILNDLGSRDRTVSGIRENTPENPVQWILNPQAVKPGALMINPREISVDEARRIVGFLLSPPDPAVAKGPGRIRESDRQLRNHRGK